MVMRTENSQKKALDDGCLRRSEGTFTFHMPVLPLKSLHLQLKKKLKVPSSKSKENKRLEEKCSTCNRPKVSTQNT